MSTTITTSRINALDGLRGAAILLVLLHNTAHFNHEDPLIARGIGVIGSAGWIGVQLFFVLSGFLITRILLETKTSPQYFKSFFARRALRILPLYYATLIVALVIAPLFFKSLYGEHRHSLDQIWLWTFLINWAHPLGAGGYGLTHFWSLAVEEQFYLVWPFLVRRWDFAKLIRVCVYVSALTLVIRIGMLACGATWPMVYQFTISRMDSLLMGALAAATLNRAPSSKTTIWISAHRLMIALVCFLGGALITRAYALAGVLTQTIGYTLLNITFTLLILAVVIPVTRGERLTQSLFSNGILRSFGKYSYGLYVIHFPIAVGMEAYLPEFKNVFGHWSGIAFVIAVGFISFIGALISFHGLEKHFLALRYRFPPNPSPPQVVLTRHA